MRTHAQARAHPDARRRRRTHTRHARARFLFLGEIGFCGTIKEKTKKNRLKTTTYKIITKKVKKSIYNHFAIGHQ